MPPKIKKKTRIKRVSIAGTGHGHQLAPEKGEVWVMNDLGTYRYCTMLWDMHDFEWTKDENYEDYANILEDLTEKERWKRTKNRMGRFERIVKHCNETGTKLMSLKKYDGTGPGLNGEGGKLKVPTSIEYPLDAIIKWSKKGGYSITNDFLNSALSMAIAYALYKKYNVIDLYGINVEMGTEWIYQRDCVSYWIGRAHGAGVRCTVSGSARRPMRITDRKVYGFHRPQATAGKMKKIKIMIPGGPPGRTQIGAVWDESGLDNKPLEMVMRVR